MRKRKITTMLFLVNLLLLTLYVSGWSSSGFRAVRSQDNGKAVLKHFAPKNEPVEVTELKIKDRAIGLGETFKGDIEWLKDLAFKVKNKSNKPITFLQIDLDFPETKATGSIMMHQLFIGQSPDITRTRTNSPLHLKPNESLSISLVPEYSGIKKLIELRQPSVENINKVVIRLGEVMFEDETRYSGGSIFKRNSDSSSPRKWVLVPDTEAIPHKN